MQQLVELQANREELEALDVPLTVAVLTLEGKEEGQGGVQVRPRTGFGGPVMVDEGRRVKQLFEVAVGSVVVVDPAGVVRWKKPGAKFKRPRTELVLHALAALVQRDQDPEAVARELVALGSTSVKKRARAARRLGELEALEAREALEAALLSDRAQDVRVAAAGALSSLRDPAVLSALARAVGDEKRDVQRAAAQALVDFDDDYRAYPGGEFRHEYTHAMAAALQARLEELAPAAEALLAERDAQLRRLGARLLWRLNHSSLQARLIELSGDRDAEVRYAALGGLVDRREDPAVRAAARARAKDGSPEVRRMAELVLEGPKGKIRE